MKCVYRMVSAVILVLSVQANAASQDTVQVGVRTPLPPGKELAPRVADSLVSFYNNPTTIRMSGRTRIPADRTIEGDLAILGGPVELAGAIIGNVAVFNGDINLSPGSRIDGNLTVVGGIATGIEQGRVSGVVTTYMVVFRYRRTADGIEYLGSQRDIDSRPTTRRVRFPSWTLGDSEIYASTRPYNRIEALPLVIGPRITTGGSNPFRFEALLIYRTEAGFDPGDDDFGYQVRVRQWLGGYRDLWVEGGVQSIIDPVENWQLSNLENSLALFFFRRDYRDYYEREGWYGRFGWKASGLFGSLEFRDERHRSVQTRGAWTILFNTEDDHRANAAADAGDLQSLALTVGVDTRNDPDEPWSGWYNQLSFEQAIGGQLSGNDADFSHLLVDLRRYTRVSRNSVVALRLLGGGRIGDNPLPAQRQHVIGGVGSLPGYDQRVFDCGARSDPSFGQAAGYGCQRFTLFQAEYRTGLSFDFRWDHQQVPGEFRGDPFAVQFDPSIVLFYNAGTAWETQEGFADFLGDTDNWVADVGAGLSLGGLGVYLAYPLVGSGGLNFFVRLAERF